MKKIADMTKCVDTEEKPDEGVCRGGCASFVEDEGVACCNEDDWRIRTLLDNLYWRLMRIKKRKER